MYTLGKAQQYRQTNSFTTNDGLPSNHIYDISQDNKGFLWIATDNGLSRFDGKYFKNFSIKDGLPSNDVIQVRMEKDGTVWANSFKQLPAYFDEVNGKFITIPNNDTLNKISQGLLLCNNLVNGGVRFYNYLGSVNFLHNKIVKCRLISIGSNGNFFIIANNKDIYISGYRATSKDKTVGYKNFISVDDKIIDSFSVKSDNPLIYGAVNDNKLYSFYNKTCIRRVSNIQINPFTYTVDSTFIPETVSSYTFSEKHLCIAGKNGTVFILDKNNLSLLYTVPTGLSGNASFTDRQNNLWVGTLDRGLLFFNNNEIKKIPIPENLLNINFLSIAVNNKGEIFAGNYYGEVLHTKDASFKKNNIPKKEAALWVIKSFCIGNKVITIDNDAINIKIKKNTGPFNRIPSPRGIKSAMVLNDSIIILCTGKGLVQFNIHTFKHRILKSVDERILSLAKFDENNIYYVSISGLYKHNLNLDTSLPIPLKKQLAGEKLHLITIAPDSSTWLSTADGNLLILQQNGRQAIIPNNKGLPENITCLLPYKNKIWMGSKTGICIVDYNITKDNLDYEIWNITKTDGLPSNTVNELAYYNDTIYAATENGLASIPANYRHTQFEITPQLTSVKINQVPVPVAATYNLKSDQNNITLEFSGIELSGHFKNLVYAIDNDTSFSDLKGNTLNIQLSSGTHNIFVKAIDINNKQGNEVLKIHFVIAAPFYKRAIFWVLITILISGLPYWLYSRRKLNKQQALFKQQLALERQRQKITADLHDDIGASLSSLQVNSAVARQLMNKDAGQASRVLEKIEAQSKNLSEKIGDIIWSMKPGKDEFMTMSSRIRNFANDILGATDIDYEIQVGKEIDKLVKDITVRKNIIFITKEAINNAVKYSRASTILVSLKIQPPHSIILTISDTGTGFEINETAGNGIANMRRRAEEINGRFNIQSTHGHGTSIVVTIPIPLINDTI